MAMFCEDILRIAIRHRHWLEGGGKKFGFFEDKLSGQRVPPRLVSMELHKVPARQPVRAADGPGRNRKLLNFPRQKTVMLFALLELAIAPLANITRGEAKLTLKQCGKVVTVAETALICDVRDALLAVA